MLLARIKYAMGEKLEAQEMVSRTITMRKGIFGDKGPRVADSMFSLARILSVDGEIVLAAKLLREVVTMSRGMPEIHGHLARGCWFLGHLKRNWIILRMLKLYWKKPRRRRLKFSAGKGPKGRATKPTCHWLAGRSGKHWSLVYRLQVFRGHCALADNKEGMH